MCQFIIELILKKEISCKVAWSKMQQRLVSVSDLFADRSRRASSVVFEHEIRFEVEKGDGSDTFKHNRPVEYSSRVVQQIKRCDSSPLRYSDFSCSFSIRIQLVDDTCSVIIKQPKLQNQEIVFFSNCMNITILPTLLIFLIISWKIKNFQIFCIFYFQQFLDIFYAFHIFLHLLIYFCHVWHILKGTFGTFSQGLIYYVAHFNFNSNKNGFPSKLSLHLLHGRRVFSQLQQSF